MTTTTTTVATNTPAGALRITGEDAFAYLQSQFSNDLRRPGVERPATYGLWLTRKGKVAADSWVIRLGAEEFLLLSDHITTEALAAKVPENVIADDVLVEPAVGERYTIFGDDAAKLLAELGLPVPNQGDWQRGVGALVVGVRRGVAPAFDVFFEGSTADSELARRIRDLVTPGGDVAIVRARVFAGIPSVPADCGPSDLPQESGMESFAVSFDKGCYLGQEVMARLHAQGRPTRTLARVVAGSHVDLSVGTKLYVGDNEAGEVRSCVSVDAGYMAFVMFKNRFADGVEAFSTAPGETPCVTRHSA